MRTADTSPPTTGRRRGARRRAGWTVVVVALLVALPQVPVAVADEDGLREERGRSSTEPPGLDGRDTHVTLLEAGHEECYEVLFGRAADLTALSAVVPDRYTLFTQPVPTGGQAGRVRVIDASCLTSVDGQQRVQRSAVTLGVAEVVARDAVPTPNSYYLLWAGTDDAVLAARLRQVGLPVEHLPASATADQPADGTSSVGFSFVGDGLDHSLTAQVVEPPQAVVDRSRFTAYHDGPRGDVRLVDVNALTAGTTSKVTGDLTGIGALQPLLLTPRLATLNGVSFGSSFRRGGWTRTVERLD